MPFRSEIAGVPVKSTRVLEYADLAGPVAPLTREGLDVQFGKVSQAQFDALHGEFGGKSEVRYDAERSYGVTDFVPPFVQALVNRDIDIPEAIALPGSGHLREGRYEGEDFKVYSYTNCHGTAWETLRAYQSSPREVTLGFGDGLVADGLYRDEAQFETVGKAESSDAESLTRLAQSLQPGDVLVYREGEGLPLHSAVYLGAGLVFEKPDTERDADSETPYRYTTLDRSLSMIVQANFDTPLTATALRPRQQLGPLEKAYGSPEADTIAQWARQNGDSIGRPLLIEHEMGGMGAIVGTHVVAASSKVLALDDHQLGALT